MQFVKKYIGIFRTSNNRVNICFRTFWMELCVSSVMFDSKFTALLTPFFFYFFFEDNSFAYFGIHDPQCTD